MAISLPVALAAAPAEAASVACGDTIVASIALTSDLVCAGSGLTVEATGISLNLNGHSIAGSGVGVGIDIAGVGSDPPVISNGAIRGFDTGVFGSPPGVTLQRVAVERNNTGVKGQGSVEIADSVISDNTTGFTEQLGFSDVRGTSFVHNGTAASLGDGSATFSHDRFVDNGTGLTTSVVDLSVSESVFIHGALGVSAGGTSSVTLDGNTFVGAGEGAHVSVDGLADARVTNNVFRRNGSVGAYVDNAGNGMVAIIGNLFSRNGFDPAGNPLISGLWVHHATTVANNVANSNAGHGIEAIDSGDGGGNRAATNHTGPQCVGVVCTR